MTIQRSHPCCRMFALLPLLVLAAMLVTGWTAPGWSADGGDSGVDVTAMHPRAYASSGGIDFVVVATPSGLFVLADVAESNTPAPITSLIIEKGKTSWTLEPQGPGLFRANGVALGTGKLPLTIVAEAAMGTLKAQTVLDIPAPTKAVPLKRPRWQWWTLVLVAGAITAGMAWWLRKPIGRWFRRGSGGLPTVIQG